MSETQGKRDGLLRRLFGRDQGAAAPAATPPDPVPRPAAEVAVETPADAASEPVAAPVLEPAAQRSWLQRLREGLKRSSGALGDSIVSVVTKRKLDADTLQDLEDALIQADLGVDTAVRIAEAVGKGRYDKEIAPEDVKLILAREVEQILAPVARPLELDPARRPSIVLVVGVNGSGKTTTIGKLAARLRAQGRSVMLAAGDTFRAAAIDQLRIWGERTGSSVVTRNIGADASGLAFDAVRQAQAEGTDVLLVDTAGRLQNKSDLMAELDKVVRVIRKLDATAPHHVLLVLDATTGQNALQQVEIFRSVAGVTGLIMTKLDGTARGGILVAIAAKYGLPVHAIGVGEGVDDLAPFEAGQFARAMSGVAQ